MWLQRIFGFVLVLLCIVSTPDGESPSIMRMETMIVINKLSTMNLIDPWQLSSIQIFWKIKTKVVTCCVSMKTFVFATRAWLTWIILVPHHSLTSSQLIKRHQELLLPPLIQQQTSKIDIQLMTTRHLLGKSYNYLDLPKGLCRRAQLKNYFLDF